MHTVVLIEGPITATEFIEFRKLMGGPDIDMPAALKSVRNALLTVCLREDGRLLGFARVVGDGVLYFYVSDVVIHPSLRGGGYRLFERQRRRGMRGRRDRRLRPRDSVGQQSGRRRSVRPLPLPL
jgi:hypothetical protein